MGPRHTFIKEEEGKKPELTVESEHVKGPTHWSWVPGGSLLNNVNSRIMIIYWVLGPRSKVPGPFINIYTYHLSYSHTGVYNI